MVSHRVLPLTGAVLLTLGVVSCSDDAPQSPTEPVSERVSLDQGLDAREVLIRASLDVRGIRPTAEELLQVSADPSSVDTLISGFVDHPGFATRVKAIFAEAVRTRQDFYRFGAYSLGLPEEEELVVQRAIAEEPLNLIAHVAVSDAPFTEILTAEYTVVDDILLEAWPVTPEGQQPGLAPRWHDVGALQRHPPQCRRTVYQLVLLAAHIDGRKRQSRPDQRHRPCILV